VATIRLTISGDKEAMARLRGLHGAGMSRAMFRAMTDSMNRVLRRAQENLTGRSLKVDTGRLRGSFGVPVVSPDGTRGSIGTDVEYARIHEYGGTTRPHLIAAKRAKTLAFVPGSFYGPVRRTSKGRFFKGDFGPVYPRFVKHPGSIIMARPYLRPALNDSLEDIRAIFQREIGKAVDGLS
jgi:phage gpG-like protein